MVHPLRSVHFKNQPLEASNKKKSMNLSEIETSLDNLNTNLHTIFGGGRNVNLKVTNSHTKHLKVRNRSMIGIPKAFVQIIMHSTKVH